MLHRAIYRSATFLLAAGLVLGTGSAFADSPDSGPASSKAALDPLEIEQALEHQIRRDPALPFDTIDVAVADGVVTLRGSVENLLAKRRAARQARTVRGVKSVVNRLVVVPVKGLTDDALAKDVKDALLVDPAADSYEVDVTVKDGRVTLAGKVDSWRESVLSEKVARGVRGVRSVENDLVITAGAPRPDAELEAEIERALRWDVYIDQALIDVDVTDGTVKLTGVVGSAAEKRRAMGKSWTRGVKDIDASGLEVARWARDADLRSGKYTDVTDFEMRHAVTEAMEQDPRTSTFKVDPTVDAGMVTLTGTVDNLRAKRAAESDARNTVGVIGVLNHIKVRDPKKRPDAKIAADIRDGLRRNPFTSVYDVHVSVEHGKVHLDGEVDSLFERSEADDIASRVTGVRDIVNRLHAESPVRVYDPYVDTWDPYGQGPLPMPGQSMPYSDFELTRRIQADFFWSPFVNGASVDVTVQDGVATLTGTVHTWTERRFARNLAYEAGASLVKNHLVVGESEEAGQ